MADCREELTVTEERMQQGEYWVADSGFLCGCACLVIDADKNNAEVHAFFIDPNCQRSGVGRLLWNKLLERAQQEKLQALHLDADPSAVAFYQAMGFCVVGNVPSGSIAGRFLPRMSRLV